MFQEPVPVVFNTRADQIGILDSDGNISLEAVLKVRSSDSAQEHPPPEAASRNEKRKGMAPIPDNLDELLNQDQLQALRQIETFGWKLHFVRRPLFQDPVPGLLSPNGDMLATLESDVRIKLVTDTDARKEAPAGEAEPAPTSAAAAGSAKTPGG